MRTSLPRKIVLFALGLLWLAPLYLLVVNALKPSTAYLSSEVWKPSGSVKLIDNIRQAWEFASLGSGLYSSVLYSVLAPLLSLLVGSLAGFAVVVLRLRHGFAWFMMIFGASIFPAQMLLVPLFLGYARTDLYDTQYGMVLIYTALSVPLAAFVMRNFFTGVSYSLYESAVLDGCSSWTAFWRIYLPLSTSALGAVFILQFVGIWNDLIFGMTLAQASVVRPVMPALMQLQDTYGGQTIPVSLAAGLLLSAPTVLLFLCAQRLFARGLSLGQTG